MVGVGIVGVFDGMVEDIDDADNLVSFSYTVRNVVGVIDELFVTGYL